MNKPESTGAKSLEEILASIRKSLADDAPSEPRAPSLKPAQPQLKPLAPDIGGPTLPAGTPAKGTGVLSAKLAGSANGAARGPSLDPDLSELLAGEPKKSASPILPEPSKPPGAKAPAEDDKDPLWFLSRLSAAAAGPTASSSAARARDAAKAPTPPPEEIKLSRPETLRPSLPPLFDSTSEPTPLAAPITAKSEKAEKSDRVDAAGQTARTQPRFMTPAADPAPAKETKADAINGLGLGKLEPGAPAFAGLTPAAIKDALPTFKASPESTDAAYKLTLAGLTPSSPPVEAEPLASASPAPGPAWAPESAPAAMGDALPTRALEQMVAELLEPVIRQWLQSNLPRLIEKAVREEVARAVAAEREAKKA
jgi:uncharacterized protein